MSLIPSVVTTKYCPPSAHYHPVFPKSYGTCEFLPFKMFNSRIKRKIFFLLFKSLFFTLGRLTMLIFRHQNSFKSLGRKSAVLAFAWKTVVKEIDFAKHCFPGELSLSMYPHTEHYSPVRCSRQRYHWQVICLVNI